MSPDQDDHRSAQPGVDVEKLNFPRNQENWKHQIGHGHVYNEEVDGFSHGHSFVS